MGRPVLLLSGAAFLPCAVSCAQSTVQPTPASLQSAVAKIQSGTYAAADADLRALLRSEPDSSQLNFLLGYVLFREQRFADSLAAYTVGARSAAPAPDDLLVVASDYIQLRSYPDAVHWLTYVTEHDPKNKQAWYLLGRTQYLLDRPEESLHAFDHCLQLDSRDLRARYNSGLALERLQRVPEAEAAYREAIAWAAQDNIADPQPWLDLGNLLIGQQKFKEAADVLATAVTRSPQNPMCQQQLGVSLAGAGDQALAVEAFQRAISLAPRAERAHYYLARSLRSLGRKQEADAEFKIVDQLHTSRNGVETPNPEAITTPSKDGRKSS